MGGPTFKKNCILGNKERCTVGTLLKVGLEIAPSLEERAEDWTGEKRENIQ